MATLYTKYIWVVESKHRLHQFNTRRIVADSLDEVLSHFNDEARKDIIKIEKEKEEVSIRF